MKLSSLFAASTIATVMMLLTASCSKERKLFETIPTDLDFVVAVNGDKMVKELGFKLEPGKPLVIPDSLGYDILLSPDQLRLLGELSATIDSKEILMFNHDKAGRIVTFSVTDRPAFCAAMRKAGCDSVASGGYSVFVDLGYSVVLSNTQAWFINENVERSVETVENLLKRASDGSIAEVEAITKTLTNGALCSAVFNYGHFNANKGGNEWIAFDVNAKDNAFEGDFKWLNADGSPADNKGLKRIDTSILQYCPTNAFLVSAVGMSTDYDWESQFNFVQKSMNTPPAQAAQMRMLLPYMKAVDGTVMIALGSAGDDNDPASIIVNDPAKLRFIAMIHMSQEKVDEAVASATAFAAEMCPVRTVGNGIYEILFNGMSFYVGNVDGCLTIANFEPSDRNDSPIARRVTGKMGGLCIQLPSLEPFKPSCPFGIDALMTSGSNSVHYVVSFPGSPYPAMPTLLKLMH